MRAEHDDGAMEDTMPVWQRRSQWILIVAVVLCTASGAWLGAYSALIFCLICQFFLVLYYLYARKSGTDTEYGDFIILPTFTGFLILLLCAINARWVFLWGVDIVATIGLLLAANKKIESNRERARRHTQSKPD